MGGSVGLPAMTKKKKEPWIGASLKMQSLGFKKRYRYKACSEKSAQS